MFDLLENGKILITDITLSGTTKKLFPSFHDVVTLFFVMNSLESLSFYLYQFVYIDILNMLFVYHHSDIVRNIVKLFSSSLSSNWSSSTFISITGLPNARKAYCFNVSLVAD